MVPAVELKSGLSTSDLEEVNRPTDGEAEAESSENSKAMMLQQ